MGHPFLAQIYRGFSGQVPMGSISRSRAVVGPREFSEMDKTDRIRACYQHACLCYVSGKQMTNATLRKRLNIKSANYPMASRIIRDTIEAGLIKPHTQVSGSKKDAKYTPFWA